MIEPDALVNLLLAQVRKLAKDDISDSGHRRLVFGVLHYKEDFQNLRGQNGFENVSDHKRLLARLGVHDLENVHLPSPGLVASVGIVENRFVLGGVSQVDWTPVVVHLAESGRISSTDLENRPLHNPVVGGSQILPPSQLLSPTSPATLRLHIESYSDPLRNLPRRPEAHSLPSRHSNPSILSAENEIRVSRICSSSIAFG